MEYNGRLYDGMTFFGDELPVMREACQEGLAWAAVKNEKIPGIASAWGYHKVLGCIYSKEQIGEVAHDLQKRKPKAPWAEN